MSQHSRATVLAPVLAPRTRRALIAQAGAAGAIALAGSGLHASAQTPVASPGASPEASPVAYSGPVGIVSPSRGEVNAAAIAKYGFTPAEKTGGSLIYVDSGDASTINPILTTDTTSYLIASLLYDPIARISIIDGTWTPGIADSWEIAADGSTYTFHLNPTVTFHDGTPLTADDVIFTFDAVTAEDTGSFRRSDVLSVLKSYRKVDEHTVEFVSVRPVANFFTKALGEIGILPKHLWQDVPLANWGSDPGSTGTDAARVVGSGAFTFVEWVPGDHITLKRNPSYWDAESSPVYIDEFIFRVHADEAAALQAFKVGEADLASIPFGQATSLRESNPELNIVDYDTFASTQYQLNQDPEKTTLFLDPKVRQALLYALDRDLIAEKVYQGFAVRADGTQPVLSIAHDPKRITTIYTYDPEKAKQLLADAGWADANGDGIVEKDGKAFSFEFQYSQTSDENNQLVPYLQQAWKAIGIDLVPKAVDVSTLFGNGESGDFDILVSGWGWYIDPDQSWYFGTEAVPPSGYNYGRYSNPAYDAITPVANAELDLQKRIDLIVEQTNLVNDDAASGFLVFRKSILGSGPRVHNFVPIAFEPFRSIPYIWIES